MMKMKTLRAVVVFQLITYMLFIGFHPVAQAEEGTLMIMEDVELPVNGSNLKYMKISSVSNLGSFQVNVSWDPEVVDVINIVNVDFPVVSYLDHVYGYANVTGYSMTGVNGNFTLAGLHFKAIGGPSAHCTIKIGYHKVLTADPQPKDITSTIINGTASIISDGMRVHAGGPYNGVVNESIQLQGSVTGGSQPYTFSWDLDEDGIFDDSFVLNPIFTWNTTGKKTIQLSVHDSTNQTVLDVTTVTILSNDLPTEPNNEPTLVAKVTPMTQAILFNITFDASQSTDPDGDVLSFLWDLGDNSISSFPLFHHFYSQQGIYHVNLIITDTFGLSNTTSFSITILSDVNNQPTAPTIEGTSYGHKNTTYRYFFSSSDSDQDSLQYIIDWGDTKTEMTEFINESTQLTRTHEWNRSGTYAIIVYSSDSYIQSNISELVVLIDARIVGSLGYLTDDDADGMFDLFHNENDTVQTTLDHLGNNQYRIDTNADGTWDYLFNSKTDTLNSAAHEDSDQNQNLTFMVLLIFFIAIIMIVAYVIFKRS